MVTFRDIAGVDVACQELLEVVACLRDSDRYSALNAKVPSGVLLCGPPGTGKTLLGELPRLPGGCVAGGPHVCFVCHVTTCLHGHVGVGALGTLQQGGEGGDAMSKGV